MKVFLFHCWGGDSRGCFRGWLQDELRKNEIEVIAPDFPNTNNPNLEEWIKKVREYVQKFNGEWVLVSHSLGGPTILRLLESFKKDEYVFAIVLVAAFAKDLGISEISGFVDKEFQFEKIKSFAKNRFIINSDNDQFIHISEAVRLAKEIDAQLIVEHNGGHINEGSGYFQFQKLLDLLLKLKNAAGKD